MSQRVTVVVYDAEVDIEDLADDVDTLRQAQAEIKKWEEVEEVTKNKIKARLTEKMPEEDPLPGEPFVVAAKIDGHVVAEVSRSTSQRVDVKGMRSILGDAIDPYLKSNTSDRLSLKD